MVSSLSPLLGTEIEGRQKVREEVMIYQGKCLGRVVLQYVWVVQVGWLFAITPARNRRV
jgi:hypothetical protein